MGEVVQNLPNPQQTGRLVAFRSDRLGARLLAVLNAARLSADYDIPYVVHWMQGTDVTAVINDATELFDADYVAERFIDRAEWMEIKPDALRIGEVTRQNSSFLAEQTALGKNTAVDQAFGVIKLADEDAETVRQRFVSMMDVVPFAAPLLPLMRALDDKLMGATAYHIRRGDLTDGLIAKNKPWPHKMVPNEFYEMHMEHALGSGGSAVLFSDDAWTLEFYRKAFPALETITQIISLDGLTEAQRDFIELYAMSRAGRIIAPERSAFSSTAVHLGNAIKCAVTNDLGPEMKREALERLMVRLRDRPESFANDGDIGQSLAHVGPFLAGEKRFGDAAGLFSKCVDDGLNIAFVYPDTMRHQHRADDVDGVMRTAEAMHERDVFGIRYFIEGEFLHGYAHIRKGDWDRGLKHMLNAFWHGPNTGAARTAIPGLLGIGVLDEKNFLPITTLQQDMHRRLGPVRNFVASFPGIIAQAGVRQMPALGCIDTMVWDWGVLLRSVSITAATRKGDVAFMRTRLHTLDPARDPAEFQSLEAVLSSYDGDPSAAADRLATLTEQHPDHPMTWQRLAHALSRAKQFVAAADAADEAVLRGKGAPAFAAWAGLAHLRNREFERAIALLTEAEEANLAFAAIPAALAEALARTHNNTDALISIDRACALAPAEADFAMRRSQILEALGRQEEAIHTLTRMVERHRAPGKLFRRLVDLMRDEGDHESAGRMIEICQERYPDHPLTRKMLAEQVA